MHTIYEDFTTVEIIDASPTEKYILPKDSKLITKDQSITTKITNNAIELSTKSADVSFSYSTQSTLFSGETEKFIYHPQDVDQLKISLPPRAILKDGTDESNPSFSPRNGKVNTNGINIYVTWEDIDEPVYVEFIPSQAQSYFVIPFFLAFVVLGLSFITFTINRKKTLTKNLYGDEKKIIAIVAKHPDGLWQKSLQIKSGLSKVKLSRKLTILTNKGLIEKIPHGTTNRIRYRGDTK